MIETLHVKKPLIAVALLVWGAGTARAQTLVCEGVLGNSGESGKTLVRFAPNEASGIGVIVDRFGSLWDRAGVGTLNRYAADGRLLGQYAIPKGVAGAAGQDKIALVGDLAVLKLDTGLYSLPVDAPPGTQVKNLNIKATNLSSNSRDGWLAAANGVEIFLVRPTTGEKKPVTTLDAAPYGVEIGPDGAVYTVGRGIISRFGDAKGAEGWPKTAAGDRMQWLDGFWWGHSYHGTIYRYDDTLEPAPGVVLGGASGSFIGHLDQNTEINAGRGLALLRPGLYAISGWGGILHLLQWQPDAMQFQIVRRIGAVPSCTGLGLDRAGNVWWSAGSWQWSDQPAAPLQHGVSTEEVSQVTMLPGDAMVGVGERNGKAAIFHGHLTTEIDTDFVTPDWGPKTRFVATASYLGAKNQRVLLGLTADGQGHLLGINNEGGFRSDAGPVTLQTATPVKAWTSLAMKDDKTLLGAGDGNIIEFERDGDNWKETARWNTWGESEKFGSQIWIAADAGRLWVSDHAGNRVLCFDAATKQLLAALGEAKGDDLMHFDAPGSLTVRGDRAIVFDSGNQRLMKLSYKK